MTWILRIFNILIQCLTAFSVGDVAAHALDYDITKSLMIRNVLLLLFCTFGHYILDRIERRNSAEDEKNAGITIAVFDLMIYVVVPVVAVVLLEVSSNYSLSGQVVLTGLALLLVMLAGRKIWTGEEASAADVPERKTVIYLILTVIKYLAGIGLGILIMVSCRRGDARLYYYLGIAGCAATAIITGLLGRGMTSGEKEEKTGVEPEEEPEDIAGEYEEKESDKADVKDGVDAVEAEEDYDSWEYWERREREELERRRKRKIKGISFGCVTLAVTVFLFFLSPIVGSVYLLSAFLTGVFLPMVFHRFIAGGSKVAADRTVLAGSVTCRVFQVILLSLAVWQLSFGAIWEYEFLMILGVILITEEYLLGHFDSKEGHYEI